MTSLKGLYLIVVADCVAVQFIQGGIKVELILVQLEQYNNNNKLSLFNTLHPCIDSRPRIGLDIQKRSKALQFPITVQK